MDIVIDPSSFINFFNLPADVILAKILFYFGWIPLAFVFLKGSIYLWIFYRQVKWGEKNAVYTLLAIDIPKGNEQTPRAVENLVTYLAGAHGTLNLMDKYWEGTYQLSISLEIISVGGYTQFLIYTPVKFRNLVESAVYSQYPDAEITEVDDYTEDFAKIRFPNEEYDLFGAEFIQSAEDAFPIRTYEEFEHSMGEPETQFKDPMATLMDLCGSLTAGEQLWSQIILRPIGFDWVEKLDAEVGKILGEKVKSKKNFLNKGADMALEGINLISSSILGASTPTTKEELKDDTLKMMNLKPKQKKQVEGIHNKTSKIGFEFKIRMIYLAKKEEMNKTKVANGFVGYIKQFTTLDLNGLKPDMDRTATSTAYFFKKRHLNYKKNRVFNNYIKRDIDAGRTPKILNVEEIATLWHFPNEGVVKASMVQKTFGRKAEAPMSLPRAEEIVGEERLEPLFLEEIKNVKKEAIKEKEVDIFEQKEEKINKEEDVFIKGAPPSNLPFI